MKHLLALLQKTCEAEKNLRENELYTRRADTPSSDFESSVRKYRIMAQKIAEFSNGKVLADIDPKSGNLLHITATVGAETIMEQLLISITRTRGEETLLELLKNPSTIDKVKRTPLAAAVSENHLQIVRLLTRYDDGRRAQHVRNAASQGKLEILQVLLSDRGDRSRLIDINVLKGVAEAGYKSPLIWKTPKQTSQHSTF